MARVIKQIDYNTRAISFTGTVVFSAMGKYVTDFLTRFHAENWKITSVSEANYSAQQAGETRAFADAEELRCVVEVLDALNVPAEIAEGQVYSVHGRVQDAILVARSGPAGRAQGDPPPGVITVPWVFLSLGDHAPGGKRPIYYKDRGEAGARVVGYAEQADVEIVSAALDAFNNQQAALQTIADK